MLQLPRMDNFTEQATGESPKSIEPNFLSNSESLADRKVKSVCNNDGVSMNPTTHEMPDTQHAIQPSPVLAKQTDPLHSDIGAEGTLPEKEIIRSEVDNYGEEQNIPPVPVIEFNLAHTTPICEMSYNEDDSHIKDPMPGYLSFPGAVDYNGQRLSIKEMFTRPGHEILPPADQPVWKQMLSYCQRWAVWASAIEDDQRRVEVINSVTGKMKQAWETAIVNGHCGQPNGHQQCCSSHRGLAGKQSLQPKEIRKRTVDESKLPAPFTSEGGKYAYSIINKELEKAGVDMDMIKSRITSEDLVAGDQLLKDMRERLQRSALDMKDWTLARLGKFDPRFNTRNLLMFSLWEVQRCRNIIKSTSHSATKTSAAKIEIYKQRANEHLALALILNERASATSDEESDNLKAATLEDQPKLITRRSGFSPAIEPPSDEEYNTQNTTGSEAEATVSDTSIDVSSTEQCLTETIIPEMQHNIEQDTTPSSEGLQLLGDAHSNRDMPVLTREKRGLEDDDSSLESEKKKLKFERSSEQQEFSPTNSTTIVQQQIPGDFHVSVNPVMNLDPNPPAPAELSRSCPQTIDPQQLAADQYSYGNVIADTHSRSPTGNHSVLTRQRKQEYIEKHWQPRINRLLTDRGIEPLQWKLKGWPHIKQILEHMNYDVVQRNQFLREFKDGFDLWDQSSTQPQHLLSNSRPPADVTIIPHSPRVDLQSPGPTSVATINSSRGFCFRYFTSTTREERREVDDMILEYMDIVIREKLPRYGYYAVFIRPGDQAQKELAHGFWDAQKKRRVEDSAWFYQNLPRPGEFRTEEPRLRHEFGYSVQPPAKKRSTAKPPSHRIVLSDLHLDDEDDDDEDIKHPQDIRSKARANRSKTAGGPAAPRAGARPKIIQDDTSSDGEYQP